MADIPMTPVGNVAVQLQQVANLMNQADDVANQDNHNTMTRNITKQLRETLPQVYSALNNGDSSLARTLLEGLDGLEAELGKNAADFTVSTPLSQLLAQCNALQRDLR